MDNIKVIRAFQIVITVVLLVAFVGVWLWARDSISVWANPILIGFFAGIVTWLYLIIRQGIDGRTDR